MLELRREHCPLAARRELRVALIWVTCSFIEVHGRCTVVGTRAGILSVFQVFLVLDMPIRARPIVRGWLGVQGL